VLTDRAQVFLPTNNALSPVGHVHWYLEEIGQGVQHVASRVASLPAYVQRANRMRAVTGEGVTFLNIPRTYYGLLEPESLVSVDTELRRDGCPSGLAEPLALELVAALRAAGPPRATHVGRAAGGTVRDTSTPVPRTGLLDAAGALSLDADAAAIDAALGGVVGYRDAPAATREMVGRVVCRSVYVNLWSLLGPQLSEATYLSIVRNQILIDVQGEVGWGGRGGGRGGLGSSRAPAASRRGRAAADLHERGAAARARHRGALPRVHTARLRRVQRRGRRAPADPPRLRRLRDPQLFDPLPLDRGVAAAASLSLARRAPGAPTTEPPLRSFARR